MCFIEKGTGEFNNGLDIRNTNMLSESCVTSDKEIKAGTSEETVIEEALAHGHKLSGYNQIK